MALNNEKKPKPSEEERRLWLERRLYCWACWYRSGGFTQFHVRSRSLGEGFRHYGETDWHAFDVKEARDTDAAIRDLKPIEREAIEMEYLKDNKAWTHAAPVGAVLAIAHEAVRMALKRKGFEA